MSKCLCMEQVQFLVIEHPTPFEPALDHQELLFTRALRIGVELSG
jgi:hypothetical protein